jgi:PKD repeat protein
MSHLGGTDGTRLPDYSIGATVLVVAIALPFFVFTRMEHAHRAGAAPPVAVTPTAQVQAVTTTADPAVPEPSSEPQALPPKAAEPARPTAKPVTVRPPNVVPNPTSAPTSTPAPGPDSAPVGDLVLRASSGPAPLTVTADASGSTDTDQTPIATVIFNFGDGTIVTASSVWTATHTYINPGTYTVAVAVIDSAHLSSTVSATVTVS